MIRSIRRRLQQQPDDGMTMVEVVVALMLVSVMILGTMYSLATMTKLTDDTQNREVAAGLAEQEIDKVRATDDVFSVHTATTTQVVNGITYTIRRYTNWVSTTGATQNCGSGGGVLLYKQVNVGVTWTNMLTLTNPIQADTVIAPATKVNDPSYGSILVSVTGADGRGRSGVGVTITPNGNGAAAVGSVSPTDSDGCAFAFKVTPGSYNVAISKGGYISDGEAATPSKAVTVTAGSSSPANFSYDASASVNISYASNFTGPSFRLPDALSTNFFSANQAYVSPTPSSPVPLYPFSGGYAVVAGTVTGCASADPQNWAAGTVAGVNLAAGVRAQAAAPAGGSASVGVPMGVVAVTWPSSAVSIHIKPVAAPAGLGDPGCQGPMYTFTPSPAPAVGSVVYLAVPFGSWQVFGATSKNVETALAAGKATAATRGEVTGTTVTLDPRNPQ